MEVERVRHTRTVVQVLESSRRDTRLKRSRPWLISCDRQKLIPVLVNELQRQELAELHALVGQARDGQALMP